MRYGYHSTVVSLNTIKLSQNQQYFFFLFQLYDSKLWSTTYIEEQSVERKNDRKRERDENSLFRKTEGLDINVSTTQNHTHFLPSFFILHLFKGFVVQ